MKYDLLKAGGEGGCSAKIPAGVLSKLLAGINIPTDNNVIVNGQTYDDAGVYRIGEQTALIVTTDFFPPICSDPYEFGQIAAANSLSDIYAMGGKPLLVLNLNMFPSTKMDLEALAEIIRGGQDKINEAGAFTMGGHTIDDQTVKYGLAVVGTIDPNRVISNSAAQVGDVLIVTKPLGTGVLVAAHRMGMARASDYRNAIEQMKTLNDHGAELMQRYNVRAATDVTGFGLIGHARSMAAASGVSITINIDALPILDGVRELLAEGCIPSTVFKNLDFTRENTLFDPSITIEDKAIVADAQTSGGLLICIAENQAESLLKELQQHYPHSKIVGRVEQKGDKLLNILHSDIK